MRFIWISAITMACSGKDVAIEGEGDDGLGGGTIEDNSCAEDTECSPWQICDASACIDGDRDNSFSEATNFTQTEDGVGGYINVPNDVDYWRYTSPGGEFIRASLDKLDMGDSAMEADLKLTIFSNTGELLTSADDYPNGERVGNYDSVVYAYLAYAGDYTFMIEDVNADFGGTAWGGQDYTYKLRMYAWNQATFGSDSTLDEPMIFGGEESNGLIMTPNSWTAVGILIEEEGDVDYIALDFQDTEVVGSDGVQLLDDDGEPYGWYNGELTVDGLLDLSGSDATPLVTLHDPEDLVSASRTGVGPDGSLKYPAMREGGWVLAVSDADGGGGPNHWYAVLINTEHRGNNYAWESESNDAATAANSIEMTEARNSSDKPFASGTIQGRVDSPGDIDHFSIMAPETIAGTTEEITEESQWVVVCITSSNQGSAIAPTLSITDTEGNFLSDGDEASTEAVATDPEGDPNLSIENIRITPGETLTLTVDPGEDSLAGPDEWYRLRAFIASFPISAYEDGGYSCP